MRRVLPLIALIGCDAGTVELLEKRHRDAGGEILDVVGSDRINDPPDVGPRDLGDPFDVFVPDSGEFGVARLLTPELDFGTHFDGSETIRSVVLEGDPRFTARVRIIAFRGRGIQLVDLMPGASFDLEPRRRATIDVAFRPSNVGPRRATLEIDLCGFGCPATVELFGFASDDPVECAPISFGVVAGPCTSSSFTCANIVEDVIELRAQEITPQPSPFQVTAVRTPLVAPGEFFEADLTYCPPDASPDMGQLSLGFVPQPFIGAGGATEVVALSGGGLGMSPCRLAFDPQIDFGTVPVGTSVDRIATIENIGSGNCELNFLGLAGTSTTFRQLAPPLGLMSLAPGSAALVQIRYSPTIGSSIDRARIRTNDPFATLIEIQLLGNGAAPIPTFRIETSTTGPLLLSNGTPLMFTPNQDDGSVEVVLPFAFSFLGQPMSTVFVTSNGFITFEAAGANSNARATIPTTRAPNAFVAFWWMDLFPNRTGTMGQVLLNTFGAAPTRVMTIGYSNVAPFSGPATVSVNAEMRLYEGSNIIEAHYGQINNAGATTSMRAAAGWESSGGTRGADALGCSPACGVPEWPTNTLIRYIPVP